MGSYSPPLQGGTVATKVYFDIAHNGQPLGKIVFGLFAETPKTSENFRALCTGEKGITYKGSKIFLIKPNDVMQGGDITHNDGSGGQSIYGSTFADENFKFKHVGLGVLSMSSKGPNTNNSQFFITLFNGPASWLDNKYVAFGAVLLGWDVIQYLEQQYGTNDGKPNQTITIYDCGQQ